MNLVSTHSNYMNKYFLILFALIASSVAKAQCIPNPVFAFLGIPGVYPLPTDPLPDGTVGSSYNNNGFTLSFICSNQEIDPSVLPMPLPFPIPAGNTIKITGMNVTGVTGLPPGMNYACNHNCTFDVNNQGCIILTGVPTTPGDYSVSFSTEFTGEISGQFGTFPIPGGLPLPVAYNLKINDNLSLTENSATGIHIYPNPASDLIYIQMDDNNMYNSIEIIDMQGKVAQKSNSAFTGLQKIDVHALASGLYRIHLKSSEGKFIKSAKIAIAR